MKLRTDQVRPNPDQPRKRFNAAVLAELADSIQRNGLLQPITVRRANVHESMSDDALAVNAIVENLQRQDITPLEEARAFQRMISAGYTCETLAQRLGIKQPHRISDRLQLLRLREGYLQLLELGHLTPSQAYELSRLPTEHQSALFDLIRSGRCETYNKLRAAADGLLAGLQQASMFEAAPASTEAERATASRFERLVDSLVALCNEGIHDSEVVVLRKVDPGRAATMVEKLTLIRADLARMEKALQQRAAQTALAGMAA
jgi:ParB family chromosome partitioning protein